MELSKNISIAKKLTISSIIIAMYVVIMALTQSFAFGAVQVRIATTLYSLSYFFPFLVLPLGVANVLSNFLLGSLGIFDILGGGLVGIITAYLVHLVKKFNLNISLITIPIIFIPGLIVPIWLSTLIKAPYIPLAFSLCLGQVIPAILGTYLVKILKDRF